MPLDWAMTQNNLGNALSTLGERESGTARLEEAVAAYRAALEEWTRERVPLDWAMATGDQGVALEYWPSVPATRSRAAGARPDSRGRGDDAGGRARATARNTSRATSGGRGASGTASGSY